MWLCFDGRGQSHHGRRPAAKTRSGRTNRPPRVAAVTAPAGFDAERLTAIDTHVHLHPVESSAVDVAAEKYFGKSGAAAGGDALAEYYRSRHIACVVFAVDERLTGRAQVSND